MPKNDKEPTLDFPSKTEAFHDEDGMYKMREPEPGKLDAEKMVQLESGIFAPMPKMKEFRILWIDTQSGHFQIEAEESYEDIQDILASAKRHEQSWYSFTDPTYGHKNIVPMAALQHPIAIVTGLKDIEAIEQQQKDYELQKRMAALQSRSKGMSPEQARELIKRHN
jgi:hypothetical protein